jgi:hypothetical protein
LSIKFEHITTLDDFIAIKGQIDALLEDYRDSLFYSPCWLIPFQEVLSSGGQALHIIGRNENGELNGAMHLTSVRTQFLKIFNPEVLALMGTRSVVSPEHLEIAIDKSVREQWFRHFEAYLTRNLESGNLAIFDSVAEDAKNVKDLAEYLKSRGYRIIIQSQDICPYLDLPDSFDRLLEGYSSKKRKSIRRDLRHNRRVFDFVDYTDIGGVEPALEIARKLHNFSRQIKGETGSFDRTGYLEFHQRLASCLETEGKLYFKFLLKDQAPVAFLYGFLNGGRFYDYQTGYDPEYADRRPGFIILARVIIDLIDRGAKRFDFLRGYEHYKLYWTNNVRNTYRYYILPPGIKSWIYYALLKIYRGWR